MQCSPKIEESRITSALEFKAAFQKRNTAWFANIHPVICDEFCMEPFQDIDNMTIEWFYKMYTNTDGDPQYRYCVLNVWQVDIKRCLKMSTEDPDDTELHRVVIRGVTHHRYRPENLRFVQGSIQESLNLRKITDKWEPQWLGLCWVKEYNNNIWEPSLNQISIGLIAEAAVQLRLSMKSVKEQKLISTAEANIKKTWQDLMAEAKVQDRDKPLKKMGKGSLIDPTCSVVALILAIYQMENFCYSELNRSCRYKDKSKVKTLGPWARALGKIIGQTQSMRKDIEKFNHEDKHDLYRGGGMTAAEIKDYLENIGKEINLWGFTSCSISKSTALSFAWEDKESGHSKVLLHFDWNFEYGHHYYLDGGVYDHEEEVLLYDGTDVEIISVDEVKNNKDEVLFTKICLKKYLKD